MRNRYLAILAVLSLLPTVLGCGGKRLPNGVLDHGQMVDFLTDAYYLEALFAVETNFTFDTVSPEMVRAYADIMERHGVTREQVEASIEYYAVHPALYSKINEEVEARINAKATGESADKPVGVDVMPVE